MDTQMIGKTIKNIEVDGGRVFIEFTDGYIFDYWASDGGYSTWGIYKNRKQYEEAQ